MKTRTRCREVNEHSNHGWVARDVRESCIRMDGHTGRHRNRRWEWEGYQGTPILILSPGASTQAQEPQK